MHHLKLSTLHLSHILHPWSTRSPLLQIYVYPDWLFSLLHCFEPRRIRARGYITFIQHYSSSNHVDSWKSTRKWENLCRVSKTRTSFPRRLFHDCTAYLSPSTQLRVSPTTMRGSTSFYTLTLAFKEEMEILFVHSPSLESWVVHWSIQVAPIWRDHPYWKRHASKLGPQKILLIQKEIDMLHQHSLEQSSEVQPFHLRSTQNTGKNFLTCAGLFTSNYGSPFYKIQTSLSWRTIPWREVWNTRVEIGYLINESFKIMRQSSSSKRATMGFHSSIPRHITHVQWLLEQDLDYSSGVQNFNHWGFENIRRSPNRGFLAHEHIMGICLLNSDIALIYESLLKQDLEWSTQGQLFIHWTS